MPLQTFLLDTSVLPIDVLSFYDGNLYQIFEKIAGLAEVKLLSVEGIRSFLLFLNTEDILEILSLPCAALQEVEGLVSLEADDKTLIVKPGCRSSIRYFFQLVKNMKNI